MNGMESPHINPSRKAETNPAMELSEAIKRIHGLIAEQEATGRMSGERQMLEAAAGKLSKLHSLTPNEIKTHMTSILAELSGRQEGSVIPDTLG